MTSRWAAGADEDPAKLSAERNRELVDEEQARGERPASRLESGTLELARLAGRRDVRAVWLEHMGKLSLSEEALLMTTWPERGRNVRGPDSSMEAAHRCPHLH